MTYFSQSSSVLDESESEVAVLLPTFSSGGDLERCFSSIDSQTLERDRFCVYVAVNGSSHWFFLYVESLLKRFSFQWKLFFVVEGGVSHARNFLLDNSFEPFLMFVDDDDFLSEEYVEGLLSVASFFCVGVGNVVSSKSFPERWVENYIGRYYNKMKSFESSKFRARKHFSSLCSKIFFRGMIGVSRFDENLANGEDSCFMAKISSNIRGVEKAPAGVCYYVFERPDSASRIRPGVVEELGRILYVSFFYTKMLFNTRYEKLFVLSRVVATMLQVKRLF